MRRVLFLLGWVGFIVCAGVLGLQELRAHWARQELTSLARGRSLAVAMGCFGCHGSELAGRGVPNPGAATGKVPSFKSETLMMDVHDEQDIREYIADGFPQRRRGSSGWDQAQAAALKMPAFKDRLTEAQLDDLVAYYSAVNDRWEMPEDVRKGRELAISLGCFQCHGMDGLGLISRSWSAMMPSFGSGSPRARFNDSSRIRLPSTL
jgi:mono/diheme cytochrome c family protein